VTPSILENCGRIFADAPAIFLREASAVKLIAQPSRDRITRRNVPIARRYWEAAALNFSVTSVPNRINGQPIRKPVFAARRIARRARKQTLCSGHQRLEKTMKKALGRFRLRTLAYRHGHREAGGHPESLLRRDP
jgi:hypothetical protein